MDRSDSTPKLRTAAVIASEVGQPLHRVRYLLRRMDIRPVAVAGNTRLYDRSVVNEIRNSLQAADGQDGLTRIPTNRKEQTP